MMRYMTSVFPAALANGITLCLAFVVFKPAIEFSICTAGEAHRIRHFG